MPRCIILKKSRGKEAIFLDFVRELPPKEIYPAFSRYKNTQLEVGYSSLDDGDEKLRRIEDMLAQIMDGNIETIYGNFELDAKSHFH
ncbi:MAG: hypothetical protein QXL15_03945 [Candidatus Korarchaeota archaeon]